jgi:hydroxyacylglutathione hydrolase
MIFEQIQLGGEEKNFAYLFGDEQTKEVAAVDPGENPRKVVDRIRALGATCSYVFATHSHIDHIWGVDDVTGPTGARFAAHPSVPGVQVPLHDGQVLHIGSVPVRVIYCPGHAADAVLFVINDEKVLTGDELFIGGVGKTFSESQARLHYANLHGRLLALPDHLEVYPGHDYGARPSSTLGEQRRTNPYFQQKDFESFWRLRQNWKQYVAEHGLKWG